MPTVPPGFHIATRRGLRSVLWRSTLAAALLAVAACERQAPAGAAMREAELEQGPDREVQGVDFTISENGVPRVRIWAGHMAEYEGSDSTYTLLSGGPDSTSTRVRVAAFTAEGDTSAVIRANRVYFHRDDDQYDARGNVVVVTPEGRRLESEHLTWNEPESKIRTPGFVRITTPDERIQGYELVAEEDLSTYRLSRVTGKVTVRE